MPKIIKDFGIAIAILAVFWIAAATVYAGQETLYSIMTINGVVVGISPSDNLSRLHECRAHNIIAERKAATSPRFRGLDVKLWCAILEEAPVYGQKIKKPSQGPMLKKNAAFPAIECYAKRFKCI